MSKLAPVHRRALHVTLIKVERERAGLGHKGRGKGLGHQCSPVNALEKRMRSNICGAVAATADKAVNTCGDNGKCSMGSKQIPAQALLGLPGEQRPYQVHAVRVHSFGEIDFGGQDEAKCELPVFGIERRRADDHLVTESKRLTNTVLKVKR